MGNGGVSIRTRKHCKRLLTVRVDERTRVKERGERKRERETRVKTDRRKKNEAWRWSGNARNHYYRGRVYASTMTRWKFSANVTGEESGTGLATAVSINNQPRLRCNAARFCIFSRNRAGKLWLLTLKHTPPPIFVCKIMDQPRNSL